MAEAQRSSPETCSYCGVQVADESAYRKHLHDAHEPSELGAIDRRRYRQYRPDPNVAVRAGSEVVDWLGALRYPVEATTTIRYAMYGLGSSLAVAVALGVRP